MSFEMEADQDALSCLLEGHETTRGLYVRIWGKHLIVDGGMLYPVWEEAFGPDGRRLSGPTGRCKNQIEFV